MGECCLNLELFIMLMLNGACSEGSSTMHCVVTPIPMNEQGSASQLLPCLEVYACMITTAKIWLLE